jgi:hypothetical protein
MKLRVLSGCAVALAAFLAAAASPARAPDAEALLRAGTDALRRGDHARAVALFERAEARATDPGLVAFNLATARYQLALAGEGGPQTLAEAFQAYQCCVGRDDPRRARALYGLGNCRLLRAAGGAPDPAGLREAIGYYEQCLREPGAGAALTADAAYNRERARLLLAQVSPDERDDPSSGDDRKDQTPEDPEQPSSGPEGAGERGSDGTPDSRSGAVPAKPEPGSQPIPTDQSPAPGAGNLPPIPDRSEPAPLSAQDAGEHLKQAARRILEERQAHRRARGRPTGAGGRAW